MHERPHPLSHLEPLVATCKTDFEAVPGMVISVGSEVRNLDLNLSLTTYETHDLGQITQLLWV